MQVFLNTILNDSCIYNHSKTLEQVSFSETEKTSEASKTPEVQSNYSSFFPS